MWKTKPVEPSAGEIEEKPLSTKSEGFDDILKVHTSPGGTQYVNVLDIFLNDRIFDDLERVSKVIGLREKVVD